MPIQAAPVLEADVAALIPTLLQADAASAPSEQCEVVKKGKKKKDAIKNRIRRMVENSNGEGFDQEQASLDDQEVIQSLMKGSILPHIVDKMIRKEDAERFDEFFTIFLKGITCLSIRRWPIFFKSSSPRPSVRLKRRQKGFRPRSNI
ncbi:hypothetical protein COCNU_scaffold008409G000010 [Cocos nucifera]|nr:hypothetical protein [Cocos nucifera]